MTTIGLTVNGRAVDKPVDPRTHLADFLRDQLDLTGTHLGCEHGVCGACTLLVDGMPARSCITFAAACDGAQVTTIEGLDNDEIATELRAAFSREHALQCGYCTPGMLISARDLVLRLETSDDRAIRVGMSGNLCRCTGYVGIVRAIRSVIEARRSRGIAADPGRRARDTWSGRIRPRHIDRRVERRCAIGCYRHRGIEKQRGAGRSGFRARQEFRRTIHRRLSSRKSLRDVRRRQACRGLPSRRIADGNSLA